MKPALTKAKVKKIFFAVPKVKDWVGRYPKKSLITEVTYDKTYKVWDIKVWSGPAGEIAAGRVDDLSSEPTAWTGPQVAWTMARGGRGAFGGKEINSYGVWLAFCAVFFIGLADFRRWRSLRNLDLLMLLSFTVSLWYFNHGRIFSSVSWVYPGLVYLLARTVWIGIRDRPPPTSRPLWPVWLLAAATVFLGGFKVGLNVWGHSNVIDVGYAGPIGAQRIVNGQSPYGHFPIEGTRPNCPGALADREGEVRERIQTNGRCESANPNGDTYGPMSYIAYIPGYLMFGWSGHWDTLPAAHFTSIAFDLLCLIGLALVGRRFGGNRLGVTLAFAWAAYPFTQYVSSSNTNDSIMPAFLIWGFWLSTSHWARGFFAGPRRLDEVRRADRRAAVGDLPGGASAAGARACSSSAASRWRPRRASGCCCSSRTHCTRRGRSGTGRSRRRSTGTRRSRSGTGRSTTPACPTCTSSSRCSRSRSSPPRSPPRFGRGGSHRSSSLP